MDLSKFLAEDIGPGDVTTQAILGDKTPKAAAEIRAKQELVLAGLEEAAWIFEHVGCQMTSDFKDGQYLEKGSVALRIEGPADALLRVERTALNFLGRMSGIATLTRKLVDKCGHLNPSLKIAATRKTTPGFRQFEKKSVVLGGGWPHRDGLYDAVLIKENHIRMAGSIEEALKRALANYDGPVEIEVTTLEDATQAASLGAHTIMLDNFTPDAAKEAARKVKLTRADVLIEVSGNITPENIMDYAPHADIISLGFLTHSAPSADFSMIFL